jgi:hypothetical protein
MYNENAPRMTIEILNVSDTILAGESVYFQAIINSGEAKNYYWAIGPNNAKYGTLRFSKLFDTSGVYDVGFYAIDSLSDTSSIGITISVSSQPVCDSLSLRIFQGSPIFKWKCEHADGEKLTYNFILKGKSENGKEKTLYTATTQEDSLQLGRNLMPNDYWEINLTATNNYGYKTKLDSIWSAE